MIAVSYRRAIAVFAALFVLAVAIGAEDTLESSRRDVLRYGLEGDIIELLKSLQSERSSVFTEDLVSLFGRTKSPGIQNGILALFADGKIDALKGPSLNLLEDPYDAPKDLVRQALSYVSALGITEAAPAVRKIIESETTDFRDQAIQTLGKIGSADDAKFLIGYMDAEISGDEKQRLIVRQNVMAALGDMKAVEIRDKLSEIAKDSGENAVIRASAATALGKMENPEDIPVLTGLFGETDPVIRTAAIGALGNMKSPNAVTVILEGFKDSYYKVRLEALGAAERQRIAEALPYILYRAKTDPVPAVKARAFEVLAKYGDAESTKWLLAVVADEKASDPERAKACDALFSSESDFDFSALEKVVLASVKDDKKTKLRYEFGKSLSRKKDPRPEAIANAFIASKDTLTKSIGLDFYDKNRYPSMDESVRLIAADEKLGALQKRAKRILDADVK